MEGGTVAGFCGNREGGEPGQTRQSLSFRGQLRSVIKHLELASLSWSMKFPLNVVVSPPGIP